MINNKHLCFVFDVGREKNIYQGNRFRCPFCNREELAEIIDEDGPIMLVKNKFPTLANTFQTVLIETDSCSADITTYDPSHMRKLITFGTDHWLQMERSGDFKSVLFFKNHGTMSGGTIDHAHMQIIGLKDIDYKQNIRDEIFDGIEIISVENGVLNISTKPNACATEFNIITTSRNDHFLADTTQNVVRYILNHQKCSSYNIFFYEWKKSIVCKIVPRYVTSPFLIGFSIPQISNRLSTIAEEIKKMYY